MGGWRDPPRRDPLNFWWQASQTVTSALVSSTRNGVPRYISFSHEFGTLSGQSLPGPPQASCLPDGSQMAPRCLPDVSKVSPRCLPGVSQVSPRCLPDVSMMSPRCLPDVPQMSPRCLSVVSKVPLRCLPDVSQMRLRCVPDVSQMCSSIRHILVLRRKTCALLRAKTSALLRRKTCAVLRPLPKIRLDLSPARPDVSSNRKSKENLRKI